MPELEKRTLICAVDTCKDGAGMFILGINLGEMSSSQPTPFCPDHAVELGKFMSALLHESE